MATRPYIARALANYGQATVIAPNNDDDIGPYAAIYVGVAGDIACIPRGMTTSVIFKSVPVGFFPVSVTRVLVTGTTADSMLGVN